MTLLMSIDGVITWVKSRFESNQIDSNKLYLGLQHTFFPCCVDVQVISPTPPELISYVHNKFLFE